MTIDEALEFVNEGVNVAVMISWQAWVMALGVGPDDAVKIVNVCIAKFGIEALFSLERADPVRADLYEAIRKLKASKLAERGARSGG